jgi:tetratricopeptide (TPR) repeat protein
MGPFAQGSWKLEGIDSKIQLYRYHAGGIFHKHRDGPTYHSKDERSFFTALIYLNSEYSGGQTTLFTDDLKHQYKVPNSTGGCFVMLQKILHEGSKVEEGVKYVLRCDILYKRNGGNAEEALKYLDKKQQAKKWFDLGAAVELSGYQDESLAYYKRAYKLDPDIEG